MAATPGRRLTRLVCHVAAPLAPTAVAAVGAGGDVAELEDVAAVRKLLDTYTMAVWTADADLLKTTYHSTAVFNGSVGQKVILTEPKSQFDDLAKQAAKGESFKAKGVPQSFRETMSINIYGSIATAIAQEDGSKITPDRPFTCTDVFQLIKIDGEWKIISQFFAFGTKRAPLADIAAIREVMNEYTTGTWTADAQMLKSIFHEKAVMNGLIGKHVMLGGPQPFFTDMEKLASKGKSFKTVGSPYASELVSVAVYGQAASAVVQEKGYAGSLAFTDAFHLLKLDGTWKIVSKLFTGAKHT